MFFSAHEAQRHADGSVHTTLGTLGWVYGEYKSFANFMRYNAAYMTKNRVYIIEAHTSRDNWKNNVKPAQVHIHGNGEYDDELFKDALDYNGE